MKIKREGGGRDEDLPSKEQASDSDTNLRFWTSLMDHQRESKPAEVPSTTIASTLLLLSRRCSEHTTVASMLLLRVRCCREHTAVVSTLRLLLLARCCR